MAERTRLVSRKAKGRSAISNGSTLFFGVDGRSRSARRFRDLYRGYLKISGGNNEELCRQAASLVLQREGLDSALARGEYVDPLHLVRLCGAINRTLAKLKSPGEAETERKRREREDQEAGLMA